MGTLEKLEKIEYHLAMLTVFTRKCNFQNLVESFLVPNLESDLPAATRDTFRHGRIYESVAREK